METCSILLGIIDISGSMTSSSDSGLVKKHSSFSKYLSAIRSESLPRLMLIIAADLCLYDCRPSCSYSLPWGACLQTIEAAVRAALLKGVHSGDGDGKSEAAAAVWMCSCVNVSLRQCMWRHGFSSREECKTFMSPGKWRTLRQPTNTVQWTSSSSVE